MTTEQMFTALLLLIGALYAGIVYELRKVRKDRHRDAAYLQWCCMAIGILAHALKIELPPPREDE